MIDENKISADADDINGDIDDDDDDDDIDDDDVDTRSAVANLQSSSL